MEETAPEGYIQKDLTVSAGKANLLALVFAMPFVLLFGVTYAFFWYENPGQYSVADWVERYHSIHWLNPVVLLGIILGGVLVHELIHGLTWAVFATNGYHSISYGIMWKFLTPYCHCNEPLLLKHYLLGGIMPAVVLGFLPSILGIVFGDLLLFLFGLWFTLAAGGDFMIIWMLRKTPPESLVQDHPHKIGCFVLEKKRPLS